MALLTKWIFFQFTCLSDHPCDTNFTTKPTTAIPIQLNDDFGGGVTAAATDNFSHRKCALPQYIALSATFAFLCVSLFLRFVCWLGLSAVMSFHFFSLFLLHIFLDRLPIIVKTILVTLMGLIYTLFIEISHDHIFSCYDKRVE